MHANASSSVEQLRQGQRLINFALLAILLIGPFTTISLSLYLLPVVLLAAVPALAFGTMRLTRALGCSTTVSVGATISLLVPLLNVLVLALVNRRATVALRHHGFRVGLLGARPRFLPPPLDVKWTPGIASAEPPVNGPLVVSNSP